MSVPPSKPTQERWSVSTSRKFHEDMQKACGAGHVSERLEQLGRDWLDYGEVNLNDVRLKIRRVKELDGKADPELKAALNDLAQVFRKQRPEVLEEAHLEKREREIEDRLDELLDEDDKSPLLRLRRIFLDLLKAYPEFKKGRSWDWAGIRARALRDFRSKSKPEWVRLNEVRKDADIRGAVRVAIEIVTLQEENKKITEQLDSIQGVKGKPPPTPDLNSLTPTQTPLRTE